MKLTPERRAEFESALAEAACTREAIEAVFNRFYGPAPHGPYPDEWYADKDNRIAGRPTGWLRFGRSGTKWVPSPAIDERSQSK